MLIYKDSSFSFGIYNDPLVGDIMTLDIYKWSHNSFKKMLVILHEYIIKNPGTYYSYTNTSVGKKINEMLGIFPTGRYIEDKEGQRYEVMAISA